MEYKFKIPKCKKIIIEINENIGSKKTLKTKEIKDKITINELRDLLKDLPENGDEYINFIAKDYIKVIFECSDKKYYFEVFNGKIKMINTAFLSEDLKLEKEIIEYINKI